jgi:hypothetical protein
MTPQAPRILIALLACTSPLLAQTAAPAAGGADASAIILAPKPADATDAPPAAGSAPHSDSAAISAAISSGVAAYNPGAASPKLSMVPRDLRESDKPRNQIPRLPTEIMSRYVVRGSRLPVFRNVDLYTTAGLIDLAFKQHPGLRIGNFFNLNSKLAYAAALNDQKMSDRQDMVDTALAMAAGGDPSEAQVVQDSIIDDSFRDGTQEGPVAVGPAPR